MSSETNFCSPEWRHSGRRGEGWQPAGGCGSSPRDAGRSRRRPGRALQDRNSFVHVFDSGCSCVQRRRSARSWLALPALAVVAQRDGSTAAILACALVVAFSRFWAACPLAGESPGQRVRLCKLCALTCHRRLRMACRCSVACVHIDAGGSGGFEGLAVMGAECASHSAARCRHVLEIGAASRDLASYLYHICERCPGRAGTVVCRVS